MMTINGDRLIPLRKKEVRTSIIHYGVWRGIVLMSDSHYRDCIITNIASMQNREIMKFYTLLT